MKLEEMIGKKVYCANTTIGKITYVGTVKEELYYEYSVTPVGVFFEETFVPERLAVLNCEFWLRDYNVEGYKNNYNNHAVFFTEKEALEHISKYKEQK